MKNFLNVIILLLFVPVFVLRAATETLQLIMSIIGMVLFAPFNRNRKLKSAGKHFARFKSGLKMLMA
jgi:hypothetical protein